MPACFAAPPEIPIYLKDMISYISLNPVNDSELYKAYNVINGFLDTCPEKKDKLEVFWKLAEIQTFYLLSRGIL